MGEGDAIDTEIDMGEGDFVREGGGGATASFPPAKRAKLSDNKWKLLNKEGVNNVNNNASPVNGGSASPKKTMSRIAELRSSDISSKLSCHILLL